MKLGRQHVQGNVIKFRTTKGDVPMELTIGDSLRRIIDASPTGDLTFLVTDYGQPFSAAGFGNKMRQWCDEAGVTGSAHGVRKAAATLAAERGATAHQLMGQFGWLTLQQATHYTRTAERNKLAAPVADLLERNKTG